MLIKKRKNNLESPSKLLYKKIKLNHININNLIKIQCFFRKKLSYFKYLKLFDENVTLINNKEFINKILKKLTLIIFIQYIIKKIYGIYLIYVNYIII